MLGRLVRIVQVAFSIVSTGVDQRVLLAKRAAFLMGVRASCYGEAGHQDSVLELRDLFYLNVYFTKR